MLLLYHSSSADIPETEFMPFVTSIDLTQYLDKAENIFVKLTETADRNRDCHYEY